MCNIRLLDCTLREAPLDGLMWGELSIKKMIHGLEKAGVDIIECGFLKDEPYVQGSSSFQKVEDIQSYIGEKKQNVIYVALVDYGRYDLKYLSDYDGKTIDAIRICFKKHEMGEVLSYAEEIRRKGYQVCIQHVDTMGFSDEEIVEFIGKVNEFQPFAYSVVDTFGAMYEDDMLHYCKLADSVLNENIILGFHAHNNLMLADANVQRFLKEMSGRRKVIVDTSLFGCGRSAGNAHTELIAEYLVKKQGATYDINELLDLIDTVVAAAQEKTSWGYSIPYFISGMHNSHTFNVKYLLKRHNIKSKDLRGIIENLDEKQKKVYDYKLLEKLYVEYFDRPIDDDEVISGLTKIFQDRDILLLAPGKTVIDQKEKIDCFIQEKAPIVIGVNNLIEGYLFDYIFYSGVNRYQNLQYQDYNDAGAPRVIMTSNIKTIPEENEMIVNYSSLIKYGWVNIDSSAILLIRLLLKCGVSQVFVAGLDGYKKFGQAFYKNELDTGLEEQERVKNTEDNLSMLEDVRIHNPNFRMHFLTDSIYSRIFER